MNRIEKEIEGYWLQYGTQVDKIALREFTKYVKPYCDKYHYQFFAGMGGWSFSGINDEDIPTKIKEILESRIDGMDGNDLGSLMPNYTPKGI